MATVEHFSTVAFLFYEIMVSERKFFGYDFNIVVISVMS